MTDLASKLASQLARFVSFGKPSDDPLAGLRAATQWLDQLPVGDAFKCQDAIRQQIKRHNAQPAPLAKEWLGVLMLLDERSRDLQDTLVSQYLRNPRMSRPQESQLWHAVYGLYWEIAHAYHTAALRISGAPARPGEVDLAPHVTLRAIRAVGQLLKWRTIRYQPAGEKLWLRLHGLYQIAEHGGFARTRLEAYRGDPCECSCETAYLHTLMLQFAHSGSLYPRQFDLIDRWLLNWHDLLRLDARCDTQVHQFAIDLAADHGPRRVRTPHTAPTARFWSTTELLQKLDELHAALHDGRTPAELGLGEHARLAESLELLTHLRHQWAALAAREQRRSARETTKQLIDVAHGLSAIVSQIKVASPTPEVSPYSGSALSYGEAEAFQIYGFVTDRNRGNTSLMKAPAAAHAAEVERWVMHDESACGYGALVEPRDMDWLRVGTLLGVKPHDATTWKLGIVRRLSRHNDDTISVGIETLAQSPELAMLSTTGASSYTVNGSDNSSAGLPHASLWLDGGDGPDSVVIDPMHYTAGKVLRMTGVADRSCIALGSPIERSEGWMRVIAEPVNG